ncbi:hypothetical protein [Nostoc sp. FACHB-133]|uniref:hypothetical protein n=1 Tax=Nostoc sp. FACHB-133 TaxID=2692835 RepID=UPI0016871CF3|nr:hypothetical protein [Nostoc sp. FACHB-133]MBD2527120.1 hypothetical protein [Nostoc sp. FACHB-133]
MLLFVGGGENATPNSPPQASLSQAGLWAGAIAGASSLRDTTRVRLNAANSTFASAR